MEKQIRKLKNKVATMKADLAKRTAENAELKAQLHADYVSFWVTSSASCVTTLL